MFKLAIGSYVRNEALYLPEWIEFHRLQGVEHFYIYDNESDDDTRDILNLYAKDGDVTVTDWPQHPGQLKAHWDAVFTAKGKARWIALIDADEFLYSPTGALLPNILRDYESFCAVTAHWVIYGSSGLMEYDKRLVIERFTHCDSKVNPHCKSIVNPMYCTGTGGNAHTVKVKGSVVDENKISMPRDYAIMENGTADILKINHYHTKSVAEAKLRWRFPRGDNFTMRKFEVSFPSHDLNEIEDTYLLKFVPEIKQRLSKKHL